MAPWLPYLMCFVQGNLVIQKDDYSPDFEARHTFTVRTGNDGRWLQSPDGGYVASISLESFSSPGNFITRPQSNTLRAKTDKDCGNLAPDCAVSLISDTSPFPDACKNKAGKANYFHYKVRGLWLASALLCCYNLVVPNVRGKSSTSAEYLDCFIRRLHADRLSILMQHLQDTQQSGNTSAQKGVECGPGAASVFLDISSARNPS